MSLKVISDVKCAEKEAHEILEAARQKAEQIVSTAESDAVKRKENSREDAFKKAQKLVQDAEKKAKTDASKILQQKRKITLPASRIDKTADHVAQMVLKGEHV